MPKQQTTLKYTICTYNPETTQCMLSLQDNVVTQLEKTHHGDYLSCFYIRQTLKKIQSDHFPADR